MVQTPFIRIEVYRLTLQNTLSHIVTFAPNKDTNFISYSFSKNINNMSGEFSFTIKPKDIDFYSIENLDIVKIYEGDELVFIGVVTKTTQNSSLQGDTVVITGKEICYLFELLFYSFDISIMCYLNEKQRQDASNISLKLNLNEIPNESLKSKLMSLYNSFKDLVNNSKQQRTFITNLIETVFNKNNFLEVDEKVKFEYPISSNLFNNSDTNYISFIKNLLPSPIYEIYGMVGNEQPYIKIRQVPFEKETWNELAKRNIVIDENYLESFSFSKSCEEVYSVFYSYIENSLISDENTQKATAISTNPYAVVNQEKMNRYGCKPMKVFFVGYGKDNSQINSSEEKESIDNKITDQLGEFLKKQNKKLEEWFYNIDEMLIGTFSLVNNWKKSPSVGDVVKFRDKEFYVTSVEHSWSYGQKGKVNLKVDRGGIYHNGVFVKA